MVTKEQRFRLRIFLLVSLFLLVVIIGLFVYPGLEEDGDRYLINFQKVSVSGLRVGSTVRYLGVDIGEVTSIRVNPDDLSSILVWVEIEKGFPVKKDMRATLNYTGITGFKVVELSGGESGSGDLPKRGQIKTKRGLGEKAEDIVTNIDRAVQGINRFLSETNLKKISLFLDNIEQTSDTVSSVLGNKRAALEESLDNIVDASRALDMTIQNLRRNVDSIKLDQLIASSHGVVEKMIPAIESLDEFIVSAGTTLNKLDSVLLGQQQALRVSLEQMQEVISNLSTFSRSLAEDPTLLIRKPAEKRRRRR